MSLADTREPSIIQLLFAIIFFRLFIVLLDSILDVNPHDGSDTSTFAKSAEEIAKQFLRGDFTVYLSNLSGGTSEYWGVLLSPFWMIPGPSKIYAAAFLALLSSIGIYNVYYMAKYYHSYQAGLLAILPLVIAPNIIAVHGSILRDGTVFLSLTTAARYLSVPDYSRGQRIIIPAFFLWFSFYLRNYLLVVILVSLAVGYFIYLSEKGRIYRRLMYFAPVAAISFVLVFRNTIEALSWDVVSVRSYGARGRTAYLEGVLPETLPETLAFSWIGLLYFMFAPFPWQVTTVADLGAFAESLLFILFCVPAFFGVRYMIHRNAPVAVGLLTGLIVGATLFGLGSANYGTAIRHRQMFLWVIVFFGGIGLADNFKLKLSST